MEAPSFGHAGLDEHLVRAERGLEHAREELARRDRPLAALPARDELGAEREHHRGQVRRRVAVRESPAERAAMAHLRVADLRGRERDDRAVLLQQRRRTRPRRAG